MLSPYNKNKNAKMLQHYKICLNWFYSYQDWYIVPTLWFNWFFNNNSPFTKRRAENKIGWKELCLVSYLDVNMSNSATQSIHVRCEEEFTLERVNSTPAFIGGPIKLLLPDTCWPIVPLFKTAQFFVNLCSWINLLMKKKKGNH